MASLLKSWFINARHTITPTPNTAFRAHFASRARTHIIQQQRQHAFKPPTLSRDQKGVDPYPEYQSENYSYIKIKGTSPKALSVDVLRILQKAGIEASVDDVAVWFQDVRKLVWYAKILPTELQKATALSQQTIDTRMISIEPVSKHALIINSSQRE